MNAPRIAFAGDRDIAVEVLKFLLSHGVRPLALMVPDAAKASHAQELVQLSGLPADKVLWGTLFRQPKGLAILHELDLDYVISIHFPCLVPESVLALPRIGMLNLHPAYLPFNRGWHTPSWAILNGTPIGATLHFMDKDIDTGDIVHQKQLAVSPADTANTLYKRIKALEMDVFAEAWPKLASRSFQRQSQDPSHGTAHKRQDLFVDEIQRIDPNQPMKAGELIKRLRALTTSRVDEAAYFEENGKRYRVQIALHEENISEKK